MFGCSQVQQMAQQVVEKKADVYVWDRQAGAPLFRQSVGHVMATEHYSSTVILSQFPFTKKVGGKQATFQTGRGYNHNPPPTYTETFGYEERRPSHMYVVSIPDPSDFYKVAGQQRAATYWQWNPKGPDETECSSAVYLSLKAGQVPFEKGQDYTSGHLWPNTLDDWLTKDSRNTAKTGVTDVW